MNVGVPELILLFFSGMAPMAFFIFVLVMMWRIMKAQESIADSMREIAKGLEGDKLSNNS